MAKRINRGDRTGVLHYLTINVRERRRPFVHDHYARCVLEELRHHCDTYFTRLIAYVLMPDHLHAIVNPRDGGVIRFVQQFKAGATTAVYRLAELTNHAAVQRWLTATPDGRAQLWQDGKHNFHLYSDWMIRQKINYIYNNPLRWGLIQHADEYPYSSFYRDVFPGTSLYHPH